MTLLRCQMSWEKVVQLFALPKTIRAMICATYAITHLSSSARKAVRGRGATSRVTKSNQVNLAFLWELQAQCMGVACLARGEHDLRTTFGIDSPPQRLSRPAHQCPPSTTPRRQHDEKTPLSFCGPMIEPEEHYPLFGVISDKYAALSRCRAFLPIPTLSFLRSD